VACPAGTHVTGGGESTFNGYTGLRLRGSYPIDDSTDADTEPDDGWRVDYANVGGLNVEVDAACASGMPKYHVTSFSVPATSRGKQGVGCGYRQVYSGGAGGATLVSVLPKDGSDSDSEPDNSIQAKVDNLRSVGVQAVVYSICGPADPDYPTVTGSAARKKGSNEHDADCPQGETVIGGGSGINAPYLGGAINSLFPLLPSGDGWGAYFDNYSSQRRTLTVIAVCANLA
jgi:hypothetical protein